ncbi:MAG: Gfo/Idh/MocA family oxidoreductase [Phycisphaerales bacterium]|nr:Gfo/Idh/MocA family oxidoreductase [Phycisphaerales bacterium]
MYKVGIFGVGYLGKFHLTNWLSIPRATVIGFYDPNDQVAEIVATKHGLKRFMSEQDLINAADIVDIVVPTIDHYRITVLALQAGKHVFVEKPITETVEQAQEIVALVKKKGVKFQVGHLVRFDKTFTNALQYELNPLFIEVHRLSQFSQRGTEVSVVLDLMIHDIDLILHVVPSTISNIYASGVAVLTDTPDIANVRIEFENGCVANLTASRISIKKMRKMRLFQKNTYIGIDFLEQKTEIVQLDAPINTNAVSLEWDTPKGKKIMQVSQVEAKESNPILAELESFINAIINNKPTLVPAEDGYRNLLVAQEIITKINNSIKPKSIN